jgi:hypothetical protein
MALTVLVTVHGIGFQQPPAAGRSGYADNLHTLLRQQLGGRLGDDPEGSGPVYVQSCAAGVPAEGLARLSRPLAGEGAEIAHVALVYSALELEHAPRFGAAIDAIARAATAFDHYATPAGAARMLGEDMLAMLHRADPAPSLTPRTDVPVGQSSPTGLVHQLLMPADARTIPAPSPLTVVIDDIACYVCRNDLRERLRAFVQAALEGVAGHADRIVLNTHSQGTVVGFDVLARYPCEKVDLLVTAGSPLRKYVDLFQWGNHTGELGCRIQAGNLRWLNVYDDRDPVADQLQPPVEWRRGEAPPLDDAATLFRVTDPLWSNLDTRDCPVQDVRVDNVAHVSGGGLRAHTYWENEKEFVPLLAKNL